MNAITILDYGFGNIGSLRNMLKKIGANFSVATDKFQLEDAKAIILPGVGAFDSAVARLDAIGAIPVLRHKAMTERIPFLGICLGMQLFAESSDEGVLPGLGLIPGKVFHLSKVIRRDDIRIPHMGWNVASPVKSGKLFPDIHSSERFYFVHSYCFCPKSNVDIAAETFYGEKFCSAIERGNIFATQFHPEKSHRFGLNLLKRFSEICLCKDQE